MHKVSHLHTLWSLWVTQRDYLVISPVKVKLYPSVCFSGASMYTCLPNNVVCVYIVSLFGHYRKENN